MITKLILITIKCYILPTTPFDLIIGRETINKHHLVSRFPAYFGFLKDTKDKTTEAEDASSNLTSSNKRKVTALTTHKRCTDKCCTPKKERNHRYRVHPTREAHHIYKITEWEPKAASGTRPEKATRARRNYPPH
jgi:hypothetical protein